MSEKTGMLRLPCPRCEGEEMIEEKLDAILAEIVSLHTTLKAIYGLNNEPIPAGRIHGALTNAWISGAAITGAINGALIGGRDA